MRADYRDWLAQRYAANTTEAQIYRAGRVEEFYGNLDEQYEKDRLQSVIAQLRYSTEDERRDRPNPSTIPFQGNIRNNLSAYRNAVERYCKFRRETAGEGAVEKLPSEEEWETVEALEEKSGGQLIGLERDMQMSLRHSIDQLESGLEIIDDGAERSVASGFIDITARDRSGNLVVLELKTGVARQRAVGQILSYMGDLVDEEPDAGVRGILIAGDFDSKARAAARMVPSLMLRTYRVMFEFADPE